MGRSGRVVRVALVLLAGALSLPVGTLAQQKNPCRTFAETGQAVCGRFLEYWNSHGGLPQQGFPISQTRSEASDTDGKVYTVQYFERAVFELHPENAAPNDVLLSLLGRFRYAEKYPSAAPSQTPNTGAGSVLFKETGKRVGGPFLAYWKSHGGLAQQGYPISDEFQERSDLDGKTYRVQYFERAVFEYHPEKSPPYDVLLSQLGTFRYGSKYAGAESCDTSGNINGRSEPTILKLGSTVRVYAWGFTPPEKLTVQVTKPDGTRISSADFGLAFTAQYSEFDVPFTPAATDPVGRYSVSIEGFSTHHRSVIYICVVR